MIVLELIAVELVVVWLLLRPADRRLVLALFGVRGSTIQVKPHS